MRALSILLKSVSWALVLIAFLGFGMINDSGNVIGNYGYASILFKVAGGALSVVAGVAAAYIFRFSKQIVVSSARDKLLRDPRSAVLYLRSFQDDALTADVQPTSFPVIFGFSTEDEQLTRALRRVGPVIAITSPNDKLPPVVDGVETYKGDDWKEGVKRHMSNVALVVFRAGNTPGVMWEFNEAIQHLLPKRLMLLVPSRMEYEAFRQLAKPLVPVPLPDFAAGKSRQPKATILALIYFRDGWQPNLVPLEVPRWRSNNLTAALIHAMQPVYNQLGLRWRAAPLSLVKLGVAAWGVSMLAAFIYAIVISPK